MLNQRVRDEVAAAAGVRMRPAWMIAMALCLGCAARPMTSSAESAEMSRSDAGRPSCDSLLPAGPNVEYEQGRWIVRHSLALHDGTVVRWPSRTSPIRVWVAMPAAPDSLSAIHHAAARDGALSWNGATPLVELRAVSDSASADVRIQWAWRLPAAVDSTTGQPREDVDGRTALVRAAQTGEVEEALIVLTLVDRRGRAFEPHDLRAMAAHETGHALGLGHPGPPVPAGDRADDGEAVMSAMVRANAPTAVDRVAMAIWYSLPVGTRCRWS